MEILLLITFPVLLVAALQSEQTSFLDVCDQNDNNCLHPGIGGSGKITFEKCPYNKTLIRLQRVSFLVCLRECIKTSNCTGVVYRRKWKLCDLIGGPIIQNDFVNESGCLYSEVSSWPMVSAISATAKFENSCFVSKHLTA